MSPRHWLVQWSELVATLYGLGKCHLQLTSLMGFPSAHADLEPLGASRSQSQAHMGGSWRWVGRVVGAVVQMSLNNFNWAQFNQTRFGPNWQTQ